jgi:hypothetical protein
MTAFPSRFIPPFENPLRVDLARDWIDPFD